MWKRDRQPRPQRSAPSSRLAAAQQNVARFLSLTALAAPGSGAGRWSRQQKQAVQSIFSADAFSSILLLPKFQARAAGESCSPLCSSDAAAHTALTLRRGTRFFAAASAPRMRFWFYASMSILLDIHHVLDSFKTGRARSRPTFVSKYVLFLVLLWRL